MPSEGLTAFRLGRAPDSNTAPRAWSPPGSSSVAIASGMSRPLMRTTRSRNGSSGFVMNENSKFFPSCSGLQYPGAAPCGCQIPTKRRAGAAAVNRSGVNAGTIDSSSGNASVTPAPRKNVRRGMCFFVTTISAASTLVTRLLVDAYRAFVAFYSHLELSALDDSQHNARKVVVLLGDLFHDGPDSWHVVVFDSPAQRVGHHLFSEHPDELRGIPQQRMPQFDGSVDLLAIV